MHNTTSKYYDDRIPIEQVLYGQFIKYDSMLRIVTREFSGSTATKINVFLDLYQFLLPVFNHLRVVDYYSIASTTLNYCAHIRDYFRTRHGVETNIIIVSTLNMSSNNTKFVSEYNNKYSYRIMSNKKMLEVYEGNIKVLKLLTNWIPNTYFKEGTVEAGVIIKHLVETDFNNKLPNIIISTSEYMYQVPAYTASHTVVFRKKTSIVNSNRVDDSFGYNSKTSGIFYIADTKNNARGDLTLNPLAISIFMILNGLPKHGVNSIYNITTSINIINYLDINDIRSGDIDSMYDGIKSFISTYGKSLKYCIEPDVFSNRFKAIDVRYQEKLYQLLPESTDKTYLVNTCDVQSIKEINDKYFISNPIDLQRLI